MKSRSVFVRIASALLTACAGLAPVLAAGGCGTSATLDPVAKAADATTHARGAQVAFSGSIGAPGLGFSFTLSGHGQFNFGAHEGSLALAISGLPPSAQAKLGTSSLEMNELFKSGSVYVGSPLFAGKLPGGARWVRLDLARVGGALGLDPSSVLSGSADPSQFLGYLKASGRISPVGQDSVRGVATTHYAGSLDLQKVAEAQPGSDRAKVREAFQKVIAELGQSTIPVEVWVDGQHLVRKIAIALHMHPQGQALDVQIQAEYFGFGPTPSVTPPAPAEVLDVTQNALQGLSGLSG
jgi:hypothetical protein